MWEYLSISGAAALGCMAWEAVHLYGLVARGQDIRSILKRPGLFWGIQIVLAVLAGVVVHAVLPLLSPSKALPLLPLASVIGFMFPEALRRLVTRQTERIRDEELEDSLKDAEKEVEEKPLAARPVWEVSRLQLEVYIRKNQSQVNSIFWVTLIVMLVGFGLVGFGVYHAVTDSAISVAVLTTASGVITQFIGATFLFIYKSTIAQASTYVETLERINSVGMAVQILDSIPDDQVETKNNARAEMVSKILYALRTPPAGKSRKKS